MAVIIIAVKDELKEKFMAKSSEKNETMSELVRTWIDKYLSKK